MARIYSPDRRSRPPDPLRRSTRPARISPSGRVSFWAQRGPSRFRRRDGNYAQIVPGAGSRSARKRIMMPCDSGVSCGYWACPCAMFRCLRVLLTRRSHVATSEPPRLLHVGTAFRPRTRRGRAEMAPSRRAQMRAFPRPPSQRALEALLQRSAISPSHARSHPAERAMGRDRAAARGRGRRAACRRPATDGGLNSAALCPPSLCNA